MTARARDSQRSRVYAAETTVRTLFDHAASTSGQVEIFGSRFTLPGERKIVSLVSIRSYLDTIVAMNTVRAHYPRAGLPITVRHRRGSTAAHYEPATATIAVPLHNRSMLRELIVLHELAHHLQPPHSAWHGPHFTAILCHLVEIALGAEAAWLMRACLTDAGAEID